VTNADYTALLFIVDRSGSMASIASDMEGAIRTLLDEQRALPGKLTVDFVRFDDQVEYVTSMADPATIVIKISPRNMTALNDAIGTAFNKFGATLAAMPEDERPGKVIVAIVTDGMENASKDFTGPQVKALIEQQREVYSWDVLYLGANQDAVAVAQSMGIHADSALTYTTTNVGAMSESLRGYVTTSRTAGAAAFSAADRAANASPAPAIDGTVRTRSSLAEPED
jgi:hypothetical protein